MNLKKAGELVKSFQSDCEWLDIGRLDDYEHAVIEFENSKSKYLQGRR